MSNDKELIELAAKAAGVIGEWVTNYDDDYYYQGNTEGVYVTPPQGGSYVWNPLTDGNDALWLAVTLEFDIITCTSTKYSYAGKKDRTATAYQEHGEDKFYDTRLAITRAAAEIGRAAP